MIGSDSKYQKKKKIHYLSTKNYLNKLLHLRYTKNIEKSNYFS